MAKKEQADYLWTVMVYLAGDNNLTDESVFSLTEMKKVNTDDRIAVVAQLDPKASSIPSMRFAINRRAPKGGAQLTPGTGTGTLMSDAVPIERPTIADRGVAGPAGRAEAAEAEEDSGETDTGDPDTLFDFIRWAKENYRADRYMVILAGHGAGTEEDFLLKDDSPSSSLSMDELKKVFSRVNEELKINVDILGMDVCLMSMVEVCSELNGFVKYLVSSESYSPTAGWPYRQILERFDAQLREDEETETEVLAKLIVDEYIRFYSDYVVGGLSVDQSVLEVSYSKRVADAVKRLATVMRRELPKRKFRDALVLAHWEAQSYNGEQFVDLQDFCERLAERFPAARDACNRVKEKVEALVKKTCFSGVENQFSYGASIYFPWAEVAPSYRQLDFAKDSGWNDFLEKYVLQTRRDPRGFKAGSKPLLDFPADRPFHLGKGKGVVGLGRFRKSAERKSAERGVNPIHSMRNPPITVVREGFSECIQANPAAASTVELLSKIGGRKKRG